MTNKNHVSLKNVLVISFVSILILMTFFYFNFSQNIQKTGLKGTRLVAPAEIDHYLNDLNFERFSEPSKVKAREILRREFYKSGYTVTEQVAGNFINIVADRGEIKEGYTLIAAHYDTVPNSSGADDNASGLAALLAIAQHTRNPNVRFVAFDGEEQNLAGSNFYASSDTLQPSLAISLETIGYYSEEPSIQQIPSFYSLFYRDLYNRLKKNDFRGDFSTAICSNNSLDFCNQYEAFGASLGLNVYSVYIPDFKLTNSFFNDLFRSDHTPFLLKNIPSVMITDTANFRNSAYHTRADTREKISSEFIAKQANSLLSIFNLAPIPPNPRLLPLFPLNFLVKWG